MPEKSQWEKNIGNGVCRIKQVENLNTQYNFIDSKIDRFRWLCATIQRNYLNKKHAVILGEGCTMQFYSSQTISRNRKGRYKLQKYNFIWSIKCCKRGDCIKYEDISYYLQYEVNTETMMLPCRPNGTLGLYIGHESDGRRNRNTSLYHARVMIVMNNVSNSQK